MSTNAIFSADESLTSLDIDYKYITSNLQSNATCTNWGYLKIHDSLSKNVFRHQFKIYNLKQPLISRSFGTIRKVCNKWCLHMVFIP